MSDAEVARVRSVYRQRVDDDRYAPDVPEQISLLAARNRAWATELRRLDRRLGHTIEVGCGAAPNLRWAREVGACTTIGVDLLPSRLAISSTLNPAIATVVGDGRRLPVATATFDTAILSTLCSSILDDEVVGQVALEVARVLKPDGIVLWFDFMRDNPRNRDVRGVSQRAVGVLFPGWQRRLHRVVLAPPIARRLRMHPYASALLEALPICRTHLAGVLER